MSAAAIEAAMLDNTSIKNIFFSTINIYLPGGRKSNKKKPEWEL